MTDGILLAEAQGDRYLNEYDTLIVDIETGAVIIHLLAEVSTLCIVHLQRWSERNL